MLFLQRITEFSNSIKHIEKQLLDSNKKCEKNELKYALIRQKNILSWFKDNKILITIYRNKDKYYIVESNLNAINSTMQIQYESNGNILSNCYNSLFTLKASQQIKSYCNFTMQKNNEMYFPIDIFSFCKYLLYGDNYFSNEYSNDNYKPILKAIKKHIIIEEQEISFEMEDLQNKYENVFALINEMKHELIQKNNKIRDLEVRMHYLELNNSDKKVSYDYDSIKQKNKVLHTEFKRIYKLIRFA